MKERKSPSPAFENSSVHLVIKEYRIRTGIKGQCTREKSIMCVKMAVQKPVLWKNLINLKQGGGSCSYCMTYCIIIPDNDPIPLTSFLKINTKLTNLMFRAIFLLSTFVNKMGFYQAEFFSPLLSLLHIV